MSPKTTHQTNHQKNKTLNILMFLSNPLLVDPRVHKEAKALIDAGHHVTIIVWDQHNEHPPTETIDNIHIHRIHNTPLMNLLPNNILRNPLWWHQAYKKAQHLIHNNKQTYDIIHCHDLDTLKIGVKLKKNYNITLIYDAHEIFHIMLKDLHPLTAYYTKKLEKKLIKHVDHIITINQPFKNYFTTQYQKPTTIVMNCKDLIYTTYEPPHNKTFTLIYIGLMIESRYFPDILTLIGNLTNIKLILAGKKEALYEKIQTLSKNYPNIEFLGTIPTKDILPLTRKANATFILADQKGQHHLNVFNKQFEAMVCGRPLIVTKGTYAAEMTEQLNCGITVDYNKSSIQNAITALRDNPQLSETLGKNAFNAAKKTYNWKNEQQKLINTYKMIT